MKARIQVLHVETKSGQSKKTGSAYSMEVCQCVIHGEHPEVGELILPKDHPKVVPGMYDADFGVAVGLDKRIGGVLKLLTPVSNVKAA